MENLLYLAIAAGIFLLGTMIVMFRHRERQASFDSSIENFRREMGALTPGGRGRSRRRKR